MCRLVEEVREACEVDITNDDVFMNARCVYMYMRMWVLVCVCVCVRERERVSVRTHMSLCVQVYK